MQAAVPDHGGLMPNYFRILYRSATSPVPPLPHPLIVSHGLAHRRLRCRILCTLVSCFEDVLQGSGGLEAAQVSSFVLQKWSG